MHAKDLSPCVREALFTHWQLRRPYSEIVAKISKEEVWYTIKRFRETNSCKIRPEKGRNGSVRTTRLVRSPALLANSVHDW